MATETEKFIIRNIAQADLINSILERIDLPEIIQKFTNAIYKGQLWVQQHTSEEIADSISSFFPGTDKDVIVKVIDNYKSIDAFSETPEVSEDGLNKLMDIIQGYDSSLIQTRPDFNVIVNNSFAEEATK